jgi:filamentous hemagglutinin
MKLGDVVSRIEINIVKLTDYALNPDNPVGYHKSRVFESVLGFTKDNYELLLHQFEETVLITEAYLKHTDAHGEHYRVDIEITGVEGQRAVVRTGWLVAPDSDVARLTTLYVKKKKQG